MRSLCTFPRTLCAAWEKLVLQNCLRTLRVSPLKAPQGRHPRLRTFPGKARSFPRNKIARRGTSAPAYERAVGDAGPYRVQRGADGAGPGGGVGARRPTNDDERPCGYCGPTGRTYTCRQWWQVRDLIIAKSGRTTHSYISEQKRQRAENDVSSTFRGVCTLLRSRGMQPRTAHCTGRGRIFKPQV